MGVRGLATLPPSFQHINNLWPPTANAIKLYLFMARQILPFPLSAKRHDFKWTSKKRERRQKNSMKGRLQTECQAWGDFSCEATEGLVTCCWPVIITEYIGSCPVEGKVAGNDYRLHTHIYFTGINWYVSSVWPISAISETFILTALRK